jgi:hypothetical protein
VFESGAIFEGKIKCRKCLHPVKLIHQIVTQLAGRQADGLAYSTMVRITESAVEKLKGFGFGGFLPGDMLLGG